MTEPVGGRTSPRVALHLRRTRLAYFLAIAAAASVAGAAAVVGSGGSAGATTTSRTVTVASGVVQSTVSGSGNLAAVHERDLAFKTAGTITKVYVEAGAKVTQGQVLARLDPTDETVDTRYLRAPFSGTIATVGVAVGDVVGGSSGASTTSTSTTGTATGATTTASTTSTDTTSAVTLVQLKAYELSVSASESDIGKLKVGQMATVTISATGEELAARVTEVGVLSSDSSSATTGSSASSAVAYPVTLRLTQSGTRLKPGMTATADIVTSQATGLTVPTQALRGNSVTVVNGAQQTRTQVQTGVAGDSTTQIVSGLKAGDKVLVTSTSATAGAGATGSTGTQAQQQNAQGATGFGGGFPGAGTGGPPAGGAPAGVGR